MKKCSNGHHLHYAITPNYAKYGEPWYCNECLETYPGESSAYCCQQCGYDVIYCYNCYNSQKDDVPKESTHDNKNTLEIENEPFVHHETTPNIQDATTKQKEPSTCTNEHRSGMEELSEDLEHVEDVTLINKETSENVVESKSPVDDKEKFPVHEITIQKNHALHALKKELSTLIQNPVEGFSVGLVDDGDLLTWEVILIGPPDTHYGGGIFKGILEFPDVFPTMPPILTFISDIWHPNVDKNGKVCLSIFNQPGDDPFGYEKAEERWMPIYTVDTIMLFVLSMLANPNPESPANVDAAKEFRENPSNFKKNVLRCVKKSEEGEAPEYYQRNAQVSRLLTKQLDQIKKKPLDGISAGLINDEDLFRWKVIIFGPPNTLYANGLFKCILEFTDEYPEVPPTLKFTSDIWHPNIDKSGKVSLPILNHAEKDSNVETIMDAVLSLLAEPNEAHPKNEDALSEMKDNYSRFKINVERCVRKSRERFDHTIAV